MPNPFTQGIGMTPTTTPAPASNPAMDMAAMLMQGGQAGPPPGSDEAALGQYGQGGMFWRELVRGGIGGALDPNSGTFSDATRKMLALENPRYG